MEFGDCEILKEKGKFRLLKTGCRNGKESFCVIGGCATKFYDDYEDALEEYNLRWMKEFFGE